MNKRIPLPTGLSFLPNGSIGMAKRGDTVVKSGGKPPKLRWQPGQIVSFRGKLHEILYAYRLTSDPREWIFVLEEREGLVGDETSNVSRFAKGLGAGSTTPRVVFDLFRDYFQAMSYFSDIPSGDTISVGNKTMLKEAKLVSSGVILP